MNPTRSKTTPVRSWRRVWLWAGAVSAAGLLGLAAAVWNVLTLSRDAAALRREMVASLELPASPRFQLNAGPVLITATRCGLALLDDVPAEVRRVLHSLSAVSVGVYDFERELGPDDRARLFAGAGRGMNRRHWTQVVGVNHDRNTVLVFMPDRAGADQSLRVCLAVCAQDRLIVASAVADGAALAELARAQAGWARF